jgi:hypothetical protein
LYANWNIPRDRGPSSLNFANRILLHRLPPQLHRPTESEFAKPEVISSVLRLGWQAVAARPAFGLTVLKQRGGIWLRH